MSSALTKGMTNTLKFLFKEKILLALLIMFALVSLLSESFFSIGNLSNLLIQIGLYGVVALGMTFVIIGGDFDLGAGSMVSFSSVLVATLLQIVSIIPAVLITLVIALVFGLINGLLVSKAKISAFIVTFGSMVMLKGLALTIGKGNPVPTNNDVFNEIGKLYLARISLIFIVLIGLLIVCNFILSRTQFGRNIYAMGGNFEVARSTGIKVDFYKCSIFVISSFFAALGGILMASRVNTGHPTIGDDMTMTVIASVVIGGTSLAGGKGNVVRTLLGVTVMMFLSNAFDSMVIQPYVQRVIKGFIIIMVVALDSYYKKCRNL